MAQKNLFEPSCPSALHICVLSEGPEKHPSGSWSFVLGEFWLREVRVCP